MVISPDSGIEFTSTLTAVLADSTLHPEAIADA